MAIIISCVYKMMGKNLVVYIIGATCYRVENRWIHFLIYLKYFEFLENKFSTFKINKAFLQKLELLDRNLNIFKENWWFKKNKIIEKIF